MPNTVVKLTNAESTWLEAAWEDRKLLINKKEHLLNCKCYFYLCRYLLCHLGWNGREEQAELIKKEALVERLVLFCCVRYLR